jgi:hypothetical protein
MSKVNKPNVEAFAKSMEVQGVSVAEVRKLERQLQQAIEKSKSLEAKYAAQERDLLAAQQRIESLTGMDDKAKVRKWSAPKRVKHGAAASILLLSDLHAAEIVDPRTVNGLNEYHEEIADRSLRQVFERWLLLTEDARNLANVKTGVLWLGGDLITGHIHEELLENTWASPLAEARWVKQRLRSGIQMVLENGGFDELIVLTSYGNHGRDTHKMRSATAADHSYEQDMYLSLRDSLDHPKLKWQIGESYHNWLNVLGYDCRFHHGDKIRYQGGVGGLTIPYSKKIAQWNKAKRAHYDFSGHFHTFGWYAPARFVSNGSVIGYNAYALGCGCDYEPPVQTCAVIDRDRGMTRVMPVFCR